MKSSISQAKAVPYVPKKAALNWIDYLVIAATVLTFATVVVVNNPHAARAETPHPGLIPASELPVQTGQLMETPNLIKAKIGLATARPWS